MATFTIYGVVGTFLNKGIINFGDATSYSYSVMVPPGLTLNNSTPVITISGTPTEYGNFSGLTSGNSIYTIGDEEEDFGWPSEAYGYYYIIELTYPDFVYYLGDSVSIFPTINGTGFTPSNFSITPALPTGLSINTSTGEISGIPTAIEANAITYTVSFFDPAETEYSYGFTIWGSRVHYDDLYIAIGETVSAFPSIIGFTPESFEFTGSPPSGLQINTNTGELYGVVNDTADIYAVNISFLINSVEYSDFICIYLSQPDCLTGSACILTPTGYKRLDQLKKNDFIISNKKYNVKQKIKQIHIIPKYVGDLYVIPQGSLSLMYPMKDIIITANHEYYANGRWHKPYKRQPKIQLKNPVDLYHIELDDTTEKIIIEGVVMESYKNTTSLI